MAIQKLRTLILHRTWPLALLLLLSLVAMGPLLQPGYFWGAHDARHDVYFIFQYDRSVQDGIWFPRWSPDFTFGYGYPFFIIYGPLASFVGELLHHFLGLGYEASVKAVFGLSILLSGLGMYGFVRSWLGRDAGLVAAVAYMVIPYHLVDVYVRAAMAEAVALAFLPLVLWGFRETIRRPRWGALLGAAAAYAGLMWTSNLVTLIFTPALAAYIVLLAITLPPAPAPRKGQGGPTWQARWQQIKSMRAGRWLAAAAAFALGLGLSAAFFIPALVEQRFINQTQWFGEYYDPARHFVYFHQLFNPAWGFGISVAGPDEAAQGGLSFQLGAVPSVLSLIALATSGRFGRGLRRELWFWGLWGGLSIFLTLGISALAWRYVPLVPYAQFPWRYLTLAMLPLSILPAALVADETRLAGADELAGGKGTAEPPSAPYAQEEIKAASPASQPRHLPGMAALVLATLLMLGSYPYLRVEMREPTPEQGPVSYAALMRFQRSSDEMTGVVAWVDAAQRPRWSPMAELWVRGKDVTTRVDYSQVPQNETLAVNSEEMGSAHEEVWYHAGGDGQSITFNRFWYPGWRAYLLDGKGGRPVRELPVMREDGPLARVVVPVPAGEGYLLLRFEDTPLRAVARWITVGTMVLIAVVCLAGLRPVYSVLHLRLSRRG